MICSFLFWLCPEGNSGNFAFFEISTLSLFSIFIHYRSVFGCVGNAGRRTFVYEFRIVFYFDFHDFNFGVLIFGIFFSILIFVQIQIWIFYNHKFVASFYFVKFRFFLNRWFLFCFCLERNANNFTFFELFCFLWFLF